MAGVSARAVGKNKVSFVPVGAPPVVHLFAKFRFPSFASIMIIHEPRNKPNRDPPAFSISVIIFLFLCLTKVEFAYKKYDI